MLAVGSVEHGAALALGEQEWADGMYPEIPESKVLDNPYQYTDFASAETHGG